MSISTFLIPYHTSPHPKNPKALSLTLPTSISQSPKHQGVAQHAPCKLRQLRLQLSPQLLQLRGRSASRRPRRAAARQRRRNRHRRAVTWRDAPAKEEVFLGEKMGKPPTQMIKKKVEDQKKRNIWGLICLRQVESLMGS